MAKNTSNKVTRRWDSAHYDTCQFLVKKGERERLKEIAAERGQSFNAFVKEAINLLLTQSGKGPTP